ncbi:MAG: tetraacyldisaccharide 4'-kinase [Ignavibacteria bacterium]|nr:tetraacyldisaccharide 4'-kinase [Ignavibacteria bacterium]
MGDVDPVEVLPYKQSSALALSCAVEARSARSIANESVELDPGAEVVAVVGIARPERFLRTLEQLGYRVAEQVVSRIITDTRTRTWIVFAPSGITESRSCYH